MKNLLRAGWRGAWRDRVFGGCMGAMALSGLYMLYVGVSTGRVKARDYVWDAGAFNCLLALALVLPIFCPVVLGREHACGTLRNKLIAGHGRLAVYFSQLLLSVWVSLLLAAAYLAPFLGLSFALGAGLSRDPGYVCILAGCSVLVLLALAAFFTMLSLLVQNRAGAIALCLTLGFIMIAFGQYLKAHLGISEEWAAMVGTNYPQGSYRALLQALYDCTLGGMVFQCASLGVESPLRVCASAVVTALSCTGLEAWAFTRLDVK